MKPYIVGVAILATTIALLAYAHSLYNPNDATTAVRATDRVSTKISVTANQYDFGKIDIFGGKVQTAYTLRNDGPDAVTIIDARTSCMCTEGEIDGYVFGMHGSSVRNIVIPSGAEKVVTATFDPLSHGPNGTGKITRELMLRTNSSESPLVRLMFSGDVVKEWTINE